VTATATRRSSFYYEALGIALQSILAHKLRSLLTLTGIIIGVASVVVVGAAISGMNSYVVERVASVLGIHHFMVARMAHVGNMTDEEWQRMDRRNKRLEWDDFQAVLRRCPSCEEVAEGRSLDVLEIDGASNNGVEQVRELRETCRFAPASSRFKIYIIDEVHMLTAAAFNALLKTLEEPPSHVKFMFATTDPEKVLPTILSRCQRFDLRRIPAALIVQHLETIARAEGVRVDEAALHAIARGADGGMRDAESTLDQLISFCGDEIAEPDVLSMFGLVARGQVLALADALIEGDAARALADLDGLARNGKDLGRLLTDLLHHIRNFPLPPAPVGHQQSAVSDYAYSCCCGQR